MQREPIMRDHLQCPGCEGRDFWHLAQAHERDVTITPMPVWLDGDGDPVGSFELFVCAGCGLTEWWAHGVGPETTFQMPRAKLVADAPACSSCLATEAWNVAMRDHVAGMAPMQMFAMLELGRPAHPLSTRVCRPCGLTRWRVAVDEGLVPDEPFRIDGCRACPSTRAVVVVAIDAATGLHRRATANEPIYEQRFVAAATRFWGPRWWGRFELRVCPDCGHVDWLAGSLDELEVDEKRGITKISGADSPPRGPFR